MQVWDLWKEREEKSGMGREILHVNANLQCLDQFNMDVQSKECLWEKSCRTQKWTGHSQSLTQAAWHDQGIGLKMEMDTECTSSWVLSTNCTLVISQIFFLKGYKNGRWPWMLQLILYATWINLSINVQDSALTEFSGSFFLRRYLEDRK